MDDDDDDEDDDEDDDDDDDDEDDEDEDEDEDDEDILLEVALGRRLDPAGRRARRRAALPPYAGGDLTLAEVAAAAQARAEANLGRLALRPLP